MVLSLSLRENPCQFSPKVLLRESEGSLSAAVAVHLPRLVQVQDVEGRSGWTGLWKGHAIELLQVVVDPALVRGLVSGLYSG
jgi:hypothetical protein